MVSFFLYTSARSRLLPAFVFASALLWGSAAQAGPALYTEAFVVHESQDECLRSTRGALVKAGMREEDITPSTYADQKGTNIQDGWLADHPSENISVLFQCNARDGVGAMAVSGGNDDATYKVYNQLWDLWMK